MIDTFALVLGHALLAVALLRLAACRAVDVDPTIAAMKGDAHAKDFAVSSAARNAARRERAGARRRTAPDNA